MAIDRYQFLDEIPPVSDDEWLLRLHFSPEHFYDGALVPSAISTSDLRERGLSIDRECIVNPEIIEKRAADQRVKLPESRVVPYLSRFQCESVRSIEYEGKVAFEVKASPFSTNFAHADILSAQPLGKGGLKKLRCLLIEKLQTLVLLDQYLQNW